MDEPFISERKALLQQWNHYLLLQDKEKALKAKDIADQFIRRTNGGHIDIDYLLVSCRHELSMAKDYGQADRLLTLIENFHSRLCLRQAYNFHFLKGVYYYSLKQYSASLDEYQLAYGLSHAVQDKIERAELYYKLGTVHFHLDYLTPSIEWVNKALNIYVQTNATKRCADCHVLLAHNYQDINDFEKAAAHLQTARELYEQLSDDQNFNILCQALGYLYSKQKRSRDAIAAFEKGLERNTNIGLLLSILYPLSKEYFQVGEIEKGKQTLANGLEICQSNGIDEYKHHFAILEARYILNDSLKRQLINGIVYFQDRQMWSYVEEYANELADMMFNEGDYKEAANFYRIASAARNKNSIRGK